MWLNVVKWFPGNFGRINKDPLYANIFKDRYQGTSAMNPEILQRAIKTSTLHG